MDNFATFIHDALADASSIATAKFGNVSSSTKANDNNQVLTEADLAIGKALIQHITQAFPGHNIIDEEAGVIDKKSDYTWVIDPIDGTSNFANGIPTYGIMLGLLKDDSPIAGGIALPGFDEVVTAESGKGAWLNSDQQLHVTNETNLLSTLVAYGIDGHQANPELTYREGKILANIVPGIRNLRASNSVFDAVQIAKGAYGGYLNRTSKIWDNVAQQIIVEEAGGVYTDFDGKPIDYSNALQRVDENFTWCMGAPALHQQLQQIIHRSS